MTSMVHIVDMTPDEIRAAAEGHRKLGQHDAADNMARLPAMLATLSDEQKARLRQLSLPALRAELSQLVLVYERIVEAADEVDRSAKAHIAQVIKKCASAGVPLDVKAIVDALVAGSEDDPDDEDEPEAVRAAGRMYFTIMVKAAIDAQRQQG